MSETTETQPTKPGNTTSDPGRAPPAPGNITSEFKMTVLTVIVGLVLLVLGLLLADETLKQVGGGMIGLAVPAYALSRGRAKGAAGLFLACCLAFGCSNPGYIKATEIDSAVKIVTARHDAYIDADAALSPEKKALQKRTSALLRRVVDTALRRDATATGTGTVQ